jgi:ribonuclease HII
MILGVDEAGRGCVIGPLVICGVLASEETIERFREIKVRDSKQLSRKKREQLGPEIVSLAEDFMLIRISPVEIDEWLGVPGLNSLEARKTAEIISHLKPLVAYIDAPGKGARGYARLINSAIHCETQVIAENFADRNYPVVSAASILAKVHRDKVIRELHIEYGDFGSGYPSDKKTREFLTQYYHREGKFPDIVRTGWATITRITGPRQAYLESSSVQN